jgi:hypothetical protein
MKVMDYEGYVWYCHAYDTYTANGAKVIRFLLMFTPKIKLEILRYSHGEYYCLYDNGFQHKVSIRSLFPSWDLRTLSRGCM